MTCPWMQQSLEEYTNICAKIRRDKIRGTAIRMERLKTQLANLEQEQERHKRNCEVCSGSHDEAEAGDLMARMAGL